MGRFSRYDREKATMLFFSGRLGVWGSVAVSVIGTVVLFVLLNVLI